MKRYSLYRRVTMVYIHQREWTEGVGSKPARKAAFLSEDSNRCREDNGIGEF